MNRLVKNWLVLAGLLVVGCGDCGDVDKDGATNNGTPMCPQGERYNPVTGLCELRNDPSNNGTNNGTSGENNGEPDSGMTDPDMGTDPIDDMGIDPVDMPGDTRCAAGRDDDGDGLTNDCECVLASNPLQADTDGDGLSDGEEDANGNCRLDPGMETDARNNDTDIDGALDGDEIAAGTDPLLQDTDGDGVLDGAEIGTCLDPLDPDTDGDGLPDGVEDGNGDGELGTCAARVYNVMCAEGESDPCKADTDGDGTPDSDEAQYRDCRPEDIQNLVTPLMVKDVAADYQLALEPGVTTSPVTWSMGALQAHAFEDIPNDYTGFIASLDPAGQTNPSLIVDDVVGQIQALYPSAVRRVSGRRITTHDSYKAAVGAVVDLPAGTAPDVARDAILAQLSGANPADLSHGLTGAIPGGATETLFVFEVVSRSATQYILSGALVTLDAYQDAAGLAGIRVDDITGGTSVAGANDMLADECVSYAITTVPQIDIIIALDASGSMQNEQAALSNFATEFAALLNATNVDWRVGVTGVACSGVASDMALSAEFRALFPPAGGFPPMGPCPSIFGMGGGNGALVGGGFTTDPAQIATRLNQVSGTNSEHTATMALAAVDRALPRTANAVDKIRPDAAVITVAITDEEDDFFSELLNFLPTNSLTLTQSQQASLATAADPFVQWALGPNVGATMFGLFWLPGETCDGAATVGHSIAYLVNETGGGAGSVCQPDITNTLGQIANASAGIASGLRLRGVPVAPTLQVIHGDSSSGMTLDLDRSRLDGFDYDPIVNRIAFRGPNPPETNDRVVIPYRRWENSVFTCVDTSDCPSEQKLKCVDGECR